MKTIFITGVQGFIGSHLAIDLFNRGYNVVGGDSVLTPNKMLLNFREQMTLEGREKELEERMKLYVMNFANMSGPQMRAFEKVDLIYHLASPIGVDNITSHPNETLREAANINRNIDIIASQFIIPVVYASSSEVFGSGIINDDSIYSIKLLNNSPRWTYAAAKTHAEFLFGTGYYSSTIVRFFNVSGPGQNPKSAVIPKFIEAAEAGDSLVILENGTRTYCDIRDAIDQIVPIGLDIMEKKQDSIYENNSYNIGSSNSDNTIDVRHLAKLVVEVFNSDSEISESEKDMDSDDLMVRILEDDNEDLGILDVNNYSVTELLESIWNYKEQKEEGE